MKFEFNSDGSLRVPEHVEEAREKLRKKVQEAEKKSKVIVDYEETAQGYEDTWRITLPSHIQKTVLFNIKKWADKQHKISKGSAWLEQEDTTHFVLTVKGYKNRCTWAHAFLNGLNTALLKDHATMIKQRSTCKHDFFVKNYF